MLRSKTLAWLLAIGALTGGCPPGQWGPLPDGTNTGPGQTAGPGEFPDCYVLLQEDEWSAELIQLINDERADRGLDPLAASAELSAQAAAVACDMIHYNYFAHVNPVTGLGPPDRLAAAGFEGTSVGENLNAGQPSPAQVFEAWMSSPDHRANIRSPDFTHVGVGIRQGGAYGLYWVLLFGGP